MQDKLIEEVQDLVAEEPKKKMKPSDFLSADDQIDPTKAHLLAGLSQKPSGSVYQGTADPELARRRHVKNKAARKARRKNR